MKNGYTGNFLNINLTTNLINREEINDQVLRQFVGGRGLGVKLLYDRMIAGIDPLSPDNMIVLTTGVLTGTKALFSSRTNITTKSPLTGMICMGNCGGFFGPELKFAGFDGIIITGRAKHFSYIWIHDGKVEIRECEDLQGMTNPATEVELKKRTDPKSRVICIGPAAEKQVKFANVYGGDDRFIGRGGTGCVFASKNLKAVVVRGSQTNTIPVSDDENFSRVVEDTRKLFQENEFFQLWRQYGTPFILTPMNNLGLLATRNYQEGCFEFHEQINGDELKKNYLVKKVSCHRCPAACICISEVKTGPYKGARCRGPEYETLCHLGSNCGNSSLPALIKGDQLCTEYGMDTMSTGNTCAFAMELFQRGIITTADTGGLMLKFGDPEVMLKLIHMIGRREGIGDILAEGVREAAKKIGRGAEKYAMHVKGLELAAYDPRGAKSQALAYATSPRGGCHHTGYAEEELYVPDFDRFTNKGKDKICLNNQNGSVLYDCTGVCAFPTQLGVIDFNIMSDLLYYATGFDELHDCAELKKIGERVFNLERMFNWRDGMMPSDDTLPKRFLEEPLKDGASAGQTVDLEPMLKSYYRLREWTPEGRPTPELLAKLDLE